MLNKFQKGVSNPFDDILDNEVRQNEKLDENSYLALKGNFLKVIKSQNGSRVLQKVLKNTNKDILSKIFHEVKGNLKDLITDSYANYFCPKFFNSLYNNERFEYLEEVKNLS